VRYTTLLSFNDENTQYQSSESEDPEDYRVGGYHAVRVGEAFCEGRYRALRKLGWGHFSTVWLCYDEVADMHVAIKFQKSAFHYAEAARDEIKLLTELRRQDPERRAYVVQLLNHFEFRGVHGTHVCLVFEVLGKSLLSFIKRCNFRGCDMGLVKIIAYHVLSGLDYIHRKCRIIHTDVKPENILFIPTKNDYERLRLATKHAAAIMKAKQERGVQQRKTMTKRDRGENQTRASEAAAAAALDPAAARRRHRGDDKGSDDESETQTASVSQSTTYSHEEEEEEDRKLQELLASEFDFDPTDSLMSGRVKVADFGNACSVDQHFSESIQTRQYRGPEVILGVGYNTTADLWSVACLLFEVATGDFLFDAHTGRDYDRDEDHLALMMELLGPIPKTFALRGHLYREYFSRNGELKHIKRMNYWTLHEVLREKYKFASEDAEEFSQFLQPMLVFDPDQRASAQDCLAHPWLREVVERFEKERKEEAKNSSSVHNESAVDSSIEPLSLASLRTPLTTTSTVNQEPVNSDDDEDDEEEGENAEEGEAGDAGEDEEDQEQEPDSPSAATGANSRATTELKYPAEFGNRSMGTSSYATSADTMGRTSASASGSKAPQGVSVYDAGSGPSSNNVLPQKVEAIRLSQTTEPSIVFQAQRTLFVEERHTQYSDDDYDKLAQHVYHDITEENVVEQHEDNLFSDSLSSHDLQLGSGAINVTPSGHDIFVNLKSDIVSDVAAVDVGRESQGSMMSVSKGSGSGASSGMPRGGHESPAPASMPSLNPGGHSGNGTSGTHGNEALAGRKPPVLSSPAGGPSTSTMAVATTTTTSTTTTVTAGPSGTTTTTAAASTSTRVVVSEKQEAYPGHNSHGHMYEGVSAPDFSTLFGDFGTPACDDLINNSASLEDGLIAGLESGERAVDE